MQPVIAVLNRDNLNLLGLRDHSHYGDASYQQLETQVYAWAKEQGLTARCFQTNFEGAFVEQIQDAATWAQGLIVNPGAWTHYAWALRDAVEIAGLPAVEIHLSDIENREEWRRMSVLADVVVARVSGEGVAGYRTALERLKEAL